MRRCTSGSGGPAVYLEDKTEQLLRQALPGAELVRGAEWRIGAVDYETDLVARIDRTAVIVEAKSAAVSAPALRGAPERVKRHIRDLVTDPSEQSARLQDLIRQATDGDTDARAALSTIELDFTGVERVVRISVTLEDFSTLAWPSAI